MHAPDALLRVRCWFSRVLARGVHASHALYMLLTRCTCISRVDSASDAYLKCTSRVLFLFLVIVGKLEQISLGTVCAKSLNCWQSSWKYSNWLSELYIRSQRSKEAKPTHSKHVFKVHKNMNNYLAALAALLLVWKIFQYFLFYFLRYCLRAKLIWSILYF